MQFPQPNYKLPIILIPLIFGALVIAGSFYYQQRKNDWLTYKQTIESQKAEEITIRITEGWSNTEIAKYLEGQGIVPAQDFLDAVKNFKIAQDQDFLPKEAEADLQGFLYPDTYRLFKSITDRQKTSAHEAAEIIIDKLLSTFGKKLPADAQNLSKKQGLSFYETTVLASIVEKETGRNALTVEKKNKLDEERQIVAGIFYNRLRANQALQSDATINYITGKNDPAPALADLQIKSPFNTYLNHGLPPTPIGNPSLSSISAVLNPAKTDYFYFLHTQPEGEPVYSKTFEEHVQNKQRYLK